jgi:hypothetical protein
MIGGVARRGRSEADSLTPETARRSPDRRLRWAIFAALAGAALVLAFLGSVAAHAPSQAAIPAALRIPKLSAAPKIDGDLADWKDAAFHDGVWDIHRLLGAPWYDPARNRLTDHGGEPAPGEDLAARYYLAWDDRYLYFGAEVVDNQSDVSDPAPEPKRWYYKDSVSLFIEAPRDEIPESFGRGDNAFCFVADPAKPPDGAWWRHGDATRTYIEEPLPKEAVDYVVRPLLRGASRGDFILEARVDMAATLGKSDPDWRPPRVGDRIGLMIVHCDPDGGGYGGHLLIYGQGDDDSSWSRAPKAPAIRDRGCDSVSAELTEAKSPIDRKSKQPPQGGDEAGRRRTCPRQSRPRSSFAAE